MRERSHGPKKINKSARQNVFAFFFVCEATLTNPTSQTFSHAKFLQTHRQMSPFIAERDQSQRWLKHEKKRARNRFFSSNEPIIIFSWNICCNLDLVVSLSGALVPKPNRKKKNNVNWQVIKKNYPKIAKNKYRHVPDRLYLGFCCRTIFGTIRLRYVVPIRARARAILSARCVRSINKINEQKKIRVILFFLSVADKAARIIHACIYFGVLWTARISDTTRSHSLTHSHFIVSLNAHRIRK